MCSVQVTHKVTGEVMVMKELFRTNDDAYKEFLKEVGSPAVLGLFLRIQSAKH